MCVIIGSLAVSAEAVEPVGWPKREGATGLEIFEVNCNGMSSEEEGGLESDLRVTLRWDWVMGEERSIGRA